MKTGRKERHPSQGPGPNARIFDSVDFDPRAVQYNLAAPKHVSGLSDFRAIGFHRPLRPSVCNQVRSYIALHFGIGLFLSLATSEAWTQDSLIRTDSQTPGSFRLTFPDRIRTPKQWIQHVSETRCRMLKVMGNADWLSDSDNSGMDSDRPPLDLQVIQNEVRNGVRYRKVQYNVIPKQRIMAWLLTPINLPQRSRSPAVLCLHQTNGEIGKDEPAGLRGDAELQYALELTQRGFVTLSPDYPSFGEYNYDFQGSLLQSGTIKAVGDNRRAIDVLQSLPEVDTNKVACIGHSLGGHNAIFTAVFDSRIRVVVSSCGFTRFHRYMKGDLKGWTSDRYMPRIALNYHSDPDLVPFDFPDLIGALAPRGFLAVAPLDDSNFEVEGVRETIIYANQAYTLFDAKDSLQADYPAAGHSFPKESRQRAYDFIGKQLDMVF